MVDLSGVSHFVRGSGNHKYTAVLKNGKRVSFGHKDYQHFKDSVPKSMGGGLYRSKDHGDAKRRASYRARHGNLRCGDGKLCISRKYSPAWFAYYLLW